MIFQKPFALLFLFFFLLALPAAASPVDTISARATALAFLKRKMPPQGRNKAEKKRQAERLSALRLLKSMPAAHIFATPQSDFVIVAADSRLPEILGYGIRHGNAAEKTTNGVAADTAADAPTPLALRQLLGSYGRCVNTSISISTAAPDGGAPVAPLLSFTRHQEAPYNAFCPYYRNDDGTLSEERCVVGCVATALEEVISYHRRTIVLTDTLHGWTTPHYTINDILPGTSVNTRLIADNYNDPANYTAEQAEAVAKLSYMLGVAAHMNWTPSSSGSSAARPVEALKRAFGFGYVHYADSYKYRPDDWLSMMRNELRQGRPVFYTGNAMPLNGHAFVVDGLDEDGLFHVNWGTNGDFDGFFRLDILYANEPSYDTTPEGAQAGFFTNHQAIFLHPDRLNVSLPDTLQRTGLELIVDSLAFLLEPEHGKETPIRLWVRNTAAYPVTTSLEFFTNDAADLHPFEDGSYCALTCVTLQPGEQRQLSVNLYFKKGGEYILRLSPDDVHIIYERPIRVPWGEPAKLTAATPRLSFPEAGTLQVEETISNDAAAGRAGLCFYYEVFKGRDYLHGGVVHPLFCYAAPGETVRHTVKFRALEAGEEYTLYVRRGWGDICHTLHFTVPSPTSISLPAFSADDNAWETAGNRYDLLGRRVRHVRRGLPHIANRRVVIE